MDQPPLANGDGPIALVMVPTRELAMQVYREISKFAKVAGCAAAAIYGGSNLKQQIAELKRGAEIVVCTPGRMIDMLTANSGRVTNLRRVTYVVLDEADRMFDMGFAPQIDRIVQNTRPDRQTMLFSATFPQAVEKLARTVLTKPVQIVVGGISVVSSTIDQHVEVLSTDAKLPRLCQLLRHHYDEGQQLVFVDTQEACDTLFRELLKQSLPCATLHGGMRQDDRDSTIADFKSGDVSLLIATSVAARGLDVKGLVCVINYEVPNHYEDYVHRVGRTGRAGNTGTAYTFLTPDEEKYAPDLVKAMEAAGQEAPDEVVCMANAYQAKRQAGELQSKDFRTSGFKSGKGFAFDAESLAKDEKSKREARNRAKRAAGVDLGDGDSEDDDDKVQIKVIGGDPAQRAELTGEGGIEQSVAEAAAKAAAKLAAVIKAKGGTVPAAAAKAAAAAARRPPPAGRRLGCRGDVSQPGRRGGRGRGCPHGGGHVGWHRRGGAQSIDACTAGGDERCGRGQPGAHRLAAAGDAEGSRGSSGQGGRGGAARRVGGPDRAWRTARGGHTLWRPVGCRARRVVALPPRTLHGRARGQRLPSAGALQGDEQGGALGHPGVHEGRHHRQGLLLPARAQPAAGRAQALLLH